MILRPRGIAAPVPTEHQIRGLGPIVISIPTLNPTDTLLTRVFNMRLVRDCPHPDNPGTRVHVFEMGAGGPHADCTSQCSRICRSRSRVPEVSTMWRSARRMRTTTRGHERLKEFDVPNSGKVDRFWFRSLYVREPNGVLFEIATDGPGFAVDEDPAKLGETVVLPPFLEPYRQQIVANLKPID